MLQRLARRRMEGGRLAPLGTSRKSTTNQKFRKS